MSKPYVVSSHDIHKDSEYAEWIVELKERFRRTQVKAAVKVNSEQLLFNWQLGADLVIRKAEEKWGSGIVEQVSLDLKEAFPKAKGFSTTNLWYMKKWYLFYESKAEKLQQLAGELESGFDGKDAALMQIADAPKIQQPVGEFPFPSVFAYVPWGHHIAIITKCKSVEEAMYYIGRTIEEAWSRSALENAIGADFFHVSGRAVSNFKDVLPAAQSQLAQEITKGTYDLGFIELPPKYDEKALESALERNITRFLLELGTEFAFVGRQKEIVVSGKTRKIDMLFYHIRLKCYVVVELKVKPFEPEFAGKLNYYVNAVDELLKTEYENPTIGLLICKSKDDTDVQWAFKGIETPMGVATYGNIKIEDVKAQLPTDEQIQEQIRMAEEEFRLEMSQADGKNAGDGNVSEPT